MLLLINWSKVFNISDFIHNNRKQKGFLLAVVVLYQFSSKSFY
jgi:hypothetical protein